ncbi:transcriptional regulator [Paractinoplanes deccanensis]|uniref:Transcriptional regulator n=1 Tax=Paractinoplanes deccanensis TaxID=113561 RepID=A0ABQ3YBE8_9ACTN|nr:Lrp/AsnC family transcriptional regulator [Actinoplanes deccanensis]GID77329.1 transcriptional regulator [Actinoplanes deccanensis]
MTNGGALRELDEVDHALLEAVQRDGRATLSDLAATIRLGVSATRARLQTLERQGIITSYAAHIDPERVGYALRAVVRMRVNGPLLDSQVTAVLEKRPQIVRCLRVTGESCYMMEVVATGMRDLEEITDDLAQIGPITTDLVYEVVADKPTPVP